MRIQQLHYIVKIVETGSMNEAAKQLFITQPSLSNAVRDLEREMGIEIFIRNPKGITLTKDGVEFLSYARQILEQTALLEERYKSKNTNRELFSVSSQHYAFVVNAFVSLLEGTDMSRYELFLRETRTYEIIDDVKNFRSEIGVLFLNSYNHDVLTKMFDDNHLTYTSLFRTRPHIFVSKNNPLASKKTGNYWKIWKTSLTLATIKGFIIPSTSLKEIFHKFPIRNQLSLVTARHFSIS